MNITAQWLDKLADLSDEHRALLQHIHAGLDNAAIATALSLSPDDVNDEIDEICQLLSLEGLDSEDAQRAALAEIYTSYMSESATARSAIGEEAEKRAKKKNGQGKGGVVVSIPENVVNIDVMTGSITAQGIEADIASSIQRRREARLKPAYLVLTQSAVDPNLTLFQLIFFDKEETT